MKPVSADGVKGILIRSMDGTYYLRVYTGDQGDFADHNFVDYDLHHSDLSVTITDPDAFFYRSGGIDRIDHSPATLGINDTTS